MHSPILFCRDGVDDFIGGLFILFASIDILSAVADVGDDAGDTAVVFDVIFVVKESRDPRKVGFDVDKCEGNFGEDETVKKK